MTRTPRFLHDLAVRHGKPGGPPEELSSDGTIALGIFNPGGVPCPEAVPGVPLCLWERH